MWRKDEPKAPSLPAQTTSASMSTSSQNPLEPAKPATLPPNTVSEGRLTRSLVLEGDITGKDDLVIDGEVHGKVRLHGGKLTIGPDGRVTADIEAPEIVVRGEVTGNIKGHDRVHLGATAKAKGEVRTRRISIEEGAQVHGLRVNPDDERPRVAGVPAANTRPDNKNIPTNQEISQVHA